MFNAYSVAPLNYKTFLNEKILIASKTGRFRPNFHQMVPHWSSGVRLCFGSIA